MSDILVPGHETHNTYSRTLYLILVDEGLNSVFACLNFGIFNGPLQNSNSKQLIQGLWSR